MKKCLIKLNILLIFLLSLSGFSEEEIKASSEAKSDETTLRFSGIPALGFGADSGFGAGVIGSAYIDQAGYRPYKMAIGAKVYLTTKWVNSHAIDFDSVNSFGLPWRISAKLGFYSTINQNYCGKASEANCDVNRAEIDADAYGKTGDERERFIKNYYQNRLMAFLGAVYSRWLLWEGDAKLELTTAYRGHYYLNRSFKEKGFYEGSLYEKDFRKETTEGYLSLLEVGLMLDSRDNEPAPNKGYWLEASVRGSSFLIGSAWDYVGANLAARFYFPLDSKQRIILASQSIVDGTFGALPFDAMSKIGGSLAMKDYTAIGGQHTGRGIREQLYVGRFKAIQQIEFRYNFLSFTVFNQNFDLNAAVFGDVGMTAWDYSRFATDMKNIYAGFGTGLRIQWNKTFVIRADLGASPSENFNPRFYLVIGNIF